MQVGWDEEPEMAQRIRDVRGCARHDLLPSCFSGKKKLIAIFLRTTQQKRKTVMHFTNRRIISRERFRTFIFHEPIKLFRR